VIGYMCDQAPESLCADPKPVVNETCTLPVGCPPQLEFVLTGTSACQTQAGGFCQANPPTTPLDIGLIPYYECRDRANNDQPFADSVCTAAGLTKPSTAWAVSPSCTLPYCPTWNDTGIANQTLCRFNTRSCCPSGIDATTGVATVCSPATGPSVFTCSMTPTSLCGSYPTSVPQRACTLPACAAVPVWCRPAITRSA